MTAPTDAELMAAEVATDAREQAQTHRERAQRARRDAAAAAAEAEEQARRLVAEAATRSQDLTREAIAADRDAERLETQGSLIDAARAAQRSAVQADQHAAELAAEYAALTGQVAELDARLGVLGVEREDSTTGLTAALERGDVDAVTNLRTRISALDDVTASLTGQRGTAQARATRIGEREWGGEFDRALEEAARCRGQVSALLDKLDPTRPERRTQAAVTHLAQQFAAGGMPADEAARTAALVVVAGDYPEAAAALIAGVSSGADAAKAPRTLVVGRPGTRPAGRAS